MDKRGMTPPRLGREHRLLGYVNIGRRQRSNKHTFRIRGRLDYVQQPHVAYVVYVYLRLEHDNEGPSIHFDGEN